MNLVATCRQKARDNRNYTRHSNKPRRKWELAKDKRKLKPAIA